MLVTRREFLKYCSLTAAALGLTATDLLRLEEVLANPAGPPIIWLQGAACTGCSESFLNRISAAVPRTAADALLNSVNLVYHPTLMSIAGEDAVDLVTQVYRQGGYILAVEGGVPTAFGGATCFAWSYDGVDVTFQEAVRYLAGRAGRIMCVGTCSAYGCIPAAPPNPTGIRSVQAVTGRPTLNLPGCPTHPDWIVWAIVQMILGKPIAADSRGRPTALFKATVHDQCPRREARKARGFGQEGLCLKELGCRGPETVAPCPLSGWNNGVNWCVGANAQCIGCTDPRFPGTRPFTRLELAPNEDRR